MWTCTPSGKKRCHQNSGEHNEQGVVALFHRYGVWNKGFDWTFTLELTDFEPVAPPPYDPFAQEDDKRS